MHEIALSGDLLTVNQVSRLVQDETVQVVFEECVHQNASRAQAFLDEHREKTVVYGLNTGFGPMASHLVGKEQLTDLQRNLIRSHAVGMGQPVPLQYVLAAMLVRLNTLCMGRSGVSVELLERLRVAINHRLVPIVPEHGAVGTSGDLVQLAHIALGLIEEGQVWFHGERTEAKEAWARIGIAPYVLKPKEGLSLINGTSFMSGIAALMCSEVDHVLSLAAGTGAWALELVKGFDDGIAERFHSFRPHPGQMAVARALRNLTGGSRLTKRRNDFQSRHRITDDTYQIDEAVQEVYSLRCIPQILGPMVDSLMQSWRIVETEINSTTDNPVVDVQQGQFWHGGHFHGEYIAMVADQMRAHLAKLMLLTERRINFFFNRKVNGFLPAFLNMKTPGLTLGLQGLQFVATSTAAQGQTMAYPHRVHSISTNADNQDVVSMGTDSALMTMRAIDQVYILLAIELVALAQVTDIMQVHDHLSPAAVHLYQAVRTVMAPVTEDRVLVDDLASVFSLARTVRIQLNWHSLTGTGSTIGQQRS
jgi:histidine ammonia-lyase